MSVLQVIVKVRSFTSDRSRSDHGLDDCGAHHASLRGINAKKGGLARGNSEYCLVTPAKVNTASLHKNAHDIIMRSSEEQKASTARKNYFSIEWSLIPLLYFYFSSYAIGYRPLVDVARA